MRKAGTKFIIAVCMLVFALSAVPTDSLGAAASGYLDVGECGDDLTYVLSNDGVLSIAGGGDMYNFSSTSVPWRSYRQLITKVTLGSNVTSIGSYAFNYCDDLRSISIPSGITSVGEYAFRGCTSLASITIPESVKEIGAYAFSGCSSMTIATISKGATSIGAYAFSGCTKLTEISIPSTVTEIGAYAFSGCTSLAKVALSKGLTKIGAYAFYNCVSLKELAIPDTVTSIGEKAFEKTGIDDTEIAYRRGSCGANLKWELYSSGQIRISGTGDMTDYTSGLAPWYEFFLDITEVVVEEGVTGVGAYAFADFTYLETVTLADSIKRIGKHAFERCTGLADMDFSASLTEISEYAFSQSGLESVLISSGGAVSIGSHAFADCKQMEQMELQKGTFSIEDYAFSGCSSLKRAAVLAVIDTMGSHMFASCTALSEVSLDTGCSKIESHMFDGCTSLASIDLPDQATEIGEYAFYNCTKLEEMLLPNSVTAIGAEAFSGCSVLAEITFSSNIKTIGEGAFAGCVGLTSITIPESADTIGSGAFSGCSGLESITLPFVGSKKDPEEASEETLFGYIFGPDNYEGGIKVTQSYTEEDSAEYYLPETLVHVTITGGKLLYGAFDQCTGLESIVLSETAASIGDCAFRGCTGLEVVTLPEQVTEIGEYAFRACSGLESIVLPDGVASLGDGTFYACTALEGVTLPETITEIADYTFYGCVKLGGITLPQKTERIGANAFEGCTELINIELPETVTAIGSGAFQDCTGILHMELPVGITEIAAETFSGCAALERITFQGNVTSIGSYAFLGCAMLAEAPVPETMEEIGEGAFSGCSSIEQIALSNTVVTIGSGAFSGCSGLKRITLSFIGGSAAAEQAAAGTLFGYIFGTEKYTGGTAVKQYYSATGTATYYIPENLTCVEITGGRLFYGAFYGCENLTTIHLSASEGLTEVAANAFYGCTRLESFTLPEGITAIGSNAFGKCLGLQEFTVISGVEKIGENAFEGCTEIKRISLPSGLAEIGDAAFKNCSGITSIAVPGTVTAIGKGAFSGCSGLERMTLPFVGCGIELTTASEKTLFGAIFGTSSYAGGTAVIQYVANSSFTNYIPSSLTQVTVTGGKLLQGAFYNCKGLTKITLPKDLTEIGNHAFYGCSGLTGMTLPESLITIGNYAFYNCTGLTEMTLPAEVANIGSYAFMNCTALLRFTLSEKAASIGSYAFSGCTGLTEISILEHVEKIDSYAFSGCTALADVNFANGIKEIGAYAFQNCSSITGIVVPDSVTTMGAAVFSGCSGLERMTLPFVGCSAGVTAASEKTLFGAIFGTSSYAGSTEVIQYIGSSYYKKYIPLSLTQVTVTGGKVLQGAFYSCKGLTKITLPKDLTEIGNHAFHGCSGLTGLALPESLITIGDYAFYNCTGLTEMTLPTGVTNIGGNAFMNCTGLLKFTLSEKAASIGSYAFSGCTGLTEISVLGHMEKIDSYAFSGCTALADVNLAVGIKEIGDYAFQNCSSITGIVVPDSVTTMGKAVFFGCSGITEITLPFVGKSATLTSAGSGSLFGYIFGASLYTGGTSTKQYYSTSSIGYTTYYLPAGLKSVTVTGGNILYGAFSNCSNLTQIRLPENLESMGNNAFWNCTSLTEIALPDNLTAIGEKAFYNCTGLTAIRIPAGVKDIAAQAFSGCNGLKNITFLGNAPSSIAETAFTGVTAVVSYPVSDPSWASCVGNQYGGTLTWQAHTHEYVAFVTEPTCTEQGYTTYRCKFCQDFYIKDYVDALGHLSVVDKGTAASCTSTGLTDGTHCLRCQETLTTQTIIPAIGHHFTEYVSNQDADYEKDGTKTAECSNGCGETDTIVEEGSRLIDTKSPKLTISLGTHQWNSYQEAGTVDLFLDKAQIVAITASDQELLLDGSAVDRLDRVYYYISDTFLSKNELESVIWKTYANQITLEPDGTYIVYAKATDKSGNISYASSAGMIVDGTAPVIKGISEGTVCCGSAEFTVTDLSIESVTDNGAVLLPVKGVYTLAGDDAKHEIIAKDRCGNETVVSIIVYKNHSWEEPVFTWSENYKTCTAKFVCGNNSSHVEEIDCTVEAKLLGGSCVTAGDVIYTATAVIDGMEKKDTCFLSGVVPGHDYKAEFTWSSDGTSCTASLVCIREGCSEDTKDHRIDGLKCTVDVETTESTCVSEGKQERTAKVTLDDVEYKTVGSAQVFPIDPNNHKHTELRNERAATCMAAGYTGDIYCSDCGELVKKGEEIQQLEHIWDDGEVTKEASCSSTGILSYTCNVCNTVREEEIPVDENHHINTVTVGVREATEERDGYTGDLCCLDCKKIIMEGTVIPAIKPPVTSPDTPGADPGDDGDNKDPGNNGDNTGSGDSGNNTGSGDNGNNTGSGSGGNNTSSGSGTGSQTTAQTGVVKGSKIQDQKGNVYTVTAIGGKTATVSFTAPKNRKITSASVPATVKIGGVSYQVTAIANSAFAGCKKLKTVTIGKNIISIGNKAFYQCTALTKITIPAKVAKIGKQAFYGAKKLKNITIKTSKLKLKNVGAKAFGKIHAKAVVKAPAKKVSAYKKILKKRGITGKQQKIRK